MNYAAEHIDRASRMTSPEARWYLRHLALSTLHHARSLERTNYDRSRASVERVAELREEGVEYARASRLYPGGAITGPAWDFNEAFWVAVPSTYWPELDSHGVYVSIWPYGDRKGDYQAEVQVLPPDVRRTQCCATRNFKTRCDAVAFGRKWIAVGLAVLAGTIPQGTTVKA